MEFKKRKYTEFNNFRYKVLSHSAELFLYGDDAGLLSFHILRKMLQELQGAF